MILILTTMNHRYTHESVEKEPTVDVRVISYGDLMDERRHVPATYIFTDLDRFTFWALGEMAQLYRKLKARGYRVMNDPALALGRFGLLRALNRAGINDFDAYRVDSLERPRKWPVFLRLEGEHKAPLSGLVEDEAELDRAIETALAKGHPRSAMLVIEYAAEPVRPGLFRKLSAFRMGDRIAGATCVHDDQWLVKYGKPGIATPELYEEEYQLVADNPYGEVLAKVFETAGVDYGRVDFGLVGGKPQIYEINSNPDVKLRPEPSPAPRRNESADLFRSIYLDALKSIDTPTTEETLLAFPPKA